MKGGELKALRQQAGMTQARAAEALGVSANFLAMMERDERPIERRTEQAIDALLRTRIDLSFSEALNKWVVAVIKPAAHFAGREHHLVAAKADKSEAQAIARGIWEEGGCLGLMIERART
jgi:transcriptional regulator with XRE-family HTH domain